MLSFKWLINVKVAYIGYKVQHAQDNWRKGKMNFMISFITQNIEFILTIIGLIFAIIAFFFSNKQKAASCVFGLLIIVCLILIVQYVRTWDDNEITNGLAQDVGSQYKENESDELSVSEEDVTGEREIIEEREPAREDLIYKDVNQLSLSINVESVDIFYDGYYYKYVNPQNPSENYIIDFDTGISGTFSYSRELTEEEIENWMHGGRIYDSDGNEVGYSGNYPCFWSNPNGKFAVQFPEGLQQGKYTYELYQCINNQWVSDTVIFTIQ